MAGRASRVRRLPSLQAERDQTVLRSTGFRVTRSDFLTYAAPPVTLGTDTNSVTVPVAATTTHLKVTLAFPSEASVGVDLGLTEYTATVKDATGRVVATSERAGIGTVSALVDIAAVHGVPGTWTVEIVGDRAVSDPDTLDSDSLLKDTVTLQVAQLVAR